MSQPTVAAPNWPSHTTFSIDVDAHPIAVARVETWITSQTTGEEACETVKPFLFVCLTGQDGQCGWGEAFVLPCREAAVAEIIHALAKEITRQGDMTPWSFRALAAKIADKHRGMDYAAATSALEMALWDLTGKLANAPLYALLGGQRQREIPIYANIWNATSGDALTLGARAVALVDQGYRAVKIHPLNPVHGLSVGQAAECVHHVRECIGRDVALMVDLDSQDRLDVALEFADLITAADPYWFEEPVDGQQFSTLSDIRQDTGLRIVTGEKQCGLPHFGSVLAAGAADILNPDIAGVGGLLDMLDIAAMAQSKGVMLSPHCWNSMTIAAAAMLHICASVPNAETAEIYPEYIPFGAQFAHVDFSLKGAHACLSDRPGLGVDIDAKALTHCATRNKVSEFGNQGAIA
ncbi:MAG: mandelate racemase/muconate lactonizing enzyme family protein [Aliishimia sp.]